MDYVLSKKEAFSILLDLRRYMDQSRVDGKHPMEVIAEEAFRAGNADLSHEARTTHDSLKDASRGNFIQLAYLTDGAPLDDIAQYAANTKFTKITKASLHPIKSTSDLLLKLEEQGRDIDWEKSSEVLAEVKREHFRNDLTMIERFGSSEGEPYTGARR